MQLSLAVNSSERLRGSIRLPSPSQVAASLLRNTCISIDHWTLPAVQRLRTTTRPQEKLRIKRRRWIRPVDIGALTQLRLLNGLRGAIDAILRASGGLQLIDQIEDVAQARFTTYGLKPLLGVRFDLCKNRTSTNSPQLRRLNPVTSEVERIERAIVDFLRQIYPLFLGCGLNIDLALPVRGVPGSTWVEVWVEGRSIERALELGRRPRTSQISFFNSSLRSSRFFAMSSHSSFSFFFGPIFHRRREVIPCGHWVRRPQGTNPTQ